MEYESYQKLYPTCSNVADIDKHEKQAIANRAHTIGHYWDENIYREFKDTAAKLKTIWESLECVVGGEWLCDFDWPEIDTAMLAVQRMRRSLELAAEQMEAATKFDLYQELDDVA